jgi:sugar/nucleoside kinase (ribokinase family)
MSLLVVGSVAFDALETPHGKVERTLGGAASYFALAASYFTPVRVVAIVGEDFTPKDKAVFHGRKIDLEGLEHATGKTFFWSGRYSKNMNERTTLITDLNVFANFNPTLPASYCDSGFIFLGNIDPTLQRSVLKQMKCKPKVVGLDTMNYWIERTPAELRETLKHTQILMINFLLSVPGFPLEEVHDPTGAGDSFAGGFMGYLAGQGRINEKILRRAMVYGSVLGSFAVERFGVERLTNLTRREITVRARRFLQLTKFSL